MPPECILRESACCANTEASEPPRELNLVVGGRDISTAEVGLRGSDGPERSVDSTPWTLQYGVPPVRLMLHGTSNRSIYL